MDIVIAVLVGFVAASVFWIGCMRRARKKPFGKTAKAMMLVEGGGGPDPTR